MRSFIKFFSVMLCSMMLFACGSDSPEQVAEKFVSNIYKGDIKSVAELVYIPEDKDTPEVKMQLEGKLNMMVGDAMAKANRLGGVDKITTEAAELAEMGNIKAARVAVNVKFKNEEKVRQNHVKLVETKKGWKVNL
ncbi:hypothetical protein A4G18_06610 [Pasteurellaceae bacterium Pebbles2]|nr:hypothetical protein [Pasteurellaceae bacterium Pebbles2]